MTDEFDITLHFVKQMIDYKLADKPLRTIKTHEMTLPIYYGAIIEVHPNNIETDIHRFDMFAFNNEHKFLSVKLKEKIYDFEYKFIANIRFELGKTSYNH